MNKNSQQHFIIPEMPTEEPRSTDFQVQINGQEVPCLTARVSAMPFNRVWPGHERPIEQSEIASFVVFDMDKPVEIAVTVLHEFSEVVIRPLSRKISSTVEGNCIKFTIDKPDQFSLEIDGRHNNLHIFANPIKSYETDSDVLYFGAGVHDIEKLELHSGQTLFVDNGAVVYARTIRAYVCENINIIGHGIIDFSRYQRTTPDLFVEEDSGSISFIRCKNITMDGVILRDATWWTVTAINCTNVRYNNLKLIGMWRYNADGLDFVNSENVTISNCFVRSFDDGIVLKGVNKRRNGEYLAYYDHMNVRNYLIEHCVVWCDWGGALEIGAETVADEYTNIVFRDCDIIHNDQGALRIQSGDRAEIHHVIYEDIRVEYSVHDTNPALQQTDDAIYIPDNQPYVGEVIRGWMHWGIWTSGPAKFPRIHDITYKNIRILSDKGMPLPAISLYGAEEGHGFDNITIENLYWNEEKLTADTALLCTNEYVTNIVIC